MLRVSTPDVPETEQHRHRERDRLIALGRRSDSGERCTLLVVNEADGSWSCHGLGAAVGVTLSQADTIAVAESILAQTDSRDPR